MQNLLSNKWLGLVVTIICLCYTNTWAGAGDADSNFTASADGIVMATGFQLDGKYLIGGSFTTVNGVNRNYCARLEADGTLDLSLDLNFSDNVRCFATQPDGKILIGGQFVTVGGEARSYLIRLNQDGSIDTDFYPNINGIVLCIALTDNGQILIGGFFTRVGDVAYRGIARLDADGSIDQTFLASTGSGAVNGLHIQENGSIILWGSFQSVNSLTRRYIARISHEGTLDPDFDPSPDGFVHTVTEDFEDRLLIGGAFSTLLDTDSQFIIERSRIARLEIDGSVDTSFNPSANDSISSIQLQVDGKILVSGRFTNICNSPVLRFNRLHEDGSLDSSFNGAANGEIQTMTLLPNGSILLGGAFTNTGGNSNQRIARISNGGTQQSLVAPEPYTVRWLRSGTAPNVDSVRFKLSQDSGESWIPLGLGSRIEGGWELTGLNLPSSGTIQVEGIAYGSRYNASSGLLRVQDAFTFTPLELWRFTHFGTVQNKTRSADTADPDGDGFVNLIEYGFGKDPNVPSAELMPAWNLMQDWAVLSFPRPETRPNLTYLIETSTDLASDSWKPVTDVGSAGFSLYLVPTVGIPNLFMRIRVVQD
jgi:uncharacterized delta-60 repeat protein